VETNYIIINLKHSNIITNEKKKSMDWDSWEQPGPGKQTRAICLLATQYTYIIINPVWIYSTV
jgi:hypothetical protein